RRRRVRARRGGRAGAQVVVEQFQNAPVLVGPTVGALEGVVFYGVGRDLPVLFPQFDQALDEAHRVLEVDVRVHHAVADEERALEAAGEVEGRALAVGYGVVLRVVEDVRGVRVVVVRPVGDGPE